MSAMIVQLSCNNSLYTYEQAALPSFGYEVGVVHRRSDEDLLSSHVGSSSDETLPAQSREITRCVAQNLLHARRGEFRYPIECE